MSEELLDLVLSDAADRMSAAVNHARREFSTVRTGRASSAFIERLSVDAYGVEMKLVEVASFSVPEARQLVVTPHDPDNLEAIERSIINANLGLSPSSDGRILRLHFPPLTEERRRDLAKVVGAMAEEAKQRVNGVRRSARKSFDDLSEDGGVSQDDIARAMDRVDGLKNKFIGRIEAAQNQKEEELLEV